MLQRELEQYEPYEKVAEEELNNARSQLSRLLKEARQQMQVLTVRSESSIAEMQAALDRYADYPDDVVNARESLQSKVSNALVYRFALVPRSLHIKCRALGLLMCILATGVSVHVLD